MNFTKEEYKARLKKVQSSMQEKGLELLISHDTANMNYLTGYDVIKEKINLAKPEAKVTTPITSTIKALKVLGINKISIFTPYTKTINDSVAGYFKKENITINSLTYFDIDSDLDIGKVDEEYLFEVLSKIDLSDSDALFISCTALPVLSIIDKLEKKIKKVVLSSNQTLIWDSLIEIKYKEKIEGFGKLFNSENI